jgi:hypothetical protein
MTIRQTIFALTIIGLTSLYSCKSDKDKVNDIVDNFMKQINDIKIEKKDINFSSVSNEYKELFLKYDYYDAQNWKLETEQESDTSFIVKSTGKTFNSFGKPIEIHQEFQLRKINGDWKITNSYNLLALNLDFKIVDQNWDFIWDFDKYDILLSLQEKLKLEIIVPCYKETSEYAQGKLRITNNSDYDIKGVTILIEHFDSNGKSVNTSDTYIWDIIRKNGYREFNWITGDCAKCSKQKFRINFIKESN